MLNPTSAQPLADAQALLDERYELLDLIGEGGFGQVFKARQFVTGHEVAVKLLRPPQGGAERWAAQQKHLARFQREMRICARLFHPHIVRPIDSGQLEDGRLYSVFEFVPGRNLAQVLAQEGALEPREAIRLMSQLLDALDCAHQRGVVHRDIKPHNIMITDTGARRNALVLDFGLSTLTEEFRTESDSGISSLLEFMGTPSYAAPEQLKSQHPDMRSDLYSWGLVHLECLTGERVMQGNSVQEVLQKQLGPEPVPLPSALEGLRLGELLRRATEKNLDKRNVTAGDLLRELETCAQDEGSKLARRFAMAHARSGGTPDKGSGSSSSSPLSEGQLRHITALCCGMSLPSFPSGPPDMDIEERASTLRARQKRCIEVAEGLGGYVGGVLGQQVLFYFGYPTAQEDAPRSAARAALKLLDDSVSSTSEPEPRLELRIGIHTGPAIVQEPRAEEHQELPNVLGTTPMIASQYQAMAEPGEALVSPDTYRLLRHSFAFEFVRRFEPHTRQPLEVSRLHQERAADLSLSEPPLVGRANELALLRHRWELVRQGVGQCILLTGEPGIGKSRLVRELRRELRATPHTVMECRCAPEERSSALRPIINLLEVLLGRRPDWSPERCRSELEGLLSRYDFDLEESLPLFAPLLSIPLGERYAPPRTPPTG